MHLYETAVSFADERGVIVDLIENERDRKSVV